MCPNLETMTIQHEFVEFIPEQLEAGIIYVSIPYCTAIHKCVCGCNNEVVTPISPKGWKLTFDGETISLSPSIGSWNLRCKSHYFIRANQIVYAPEWGWENSTAKDEKKRKKKRKSSLWSKKF